MVREKKEFKVRVNRMNIIYNEDCFETFKRIDDKSIDMILCDLPYGTTACKWDTRVPLEPLWKEYKRIIKKNGAIVLTASQPFTSILVMSNLEWFRYEWIYQKRCASNFAQAKYSPMKEHENCLVFGQGKLKYNPILENRKGSGAERVRHKFNTTKSGEFTSIKSALPNPTRLRYPSSVQEFNNRDIEARGLHPTQKPVALFEYLIKTYTNKGDLVLDNCIGSGTTAIACININRNYIGCELDKTYYDICMERIEEHLQKGRKEFEDKD